MCGGPEDNPCPFHACLRQREWLDRAFPYNRGDAADDIASFPDLTGEACSKAAVVEAVEQLATALGLPLIGPDGRRSFGGHVCRVSGAVHLADVGVEIRATASPPTKGLDFGGFDSSNLLILKGGNAHVR